MVNKKQKFSKYYRTRYPEDPDVFSETSIASQNGLAKCIDELLESNEGSKYHIYLTSQRGFGKTTIVLELIQWLAKDPNLFFPVYVGRTNAHAQTVQDLFRKTMEIEMGDPEAAEFVSILGSFLGIFKSKTIKHRRKIGVWSAIWRTLTFRKPIYDEVEKIYRPSIVIVDDAVDVNSVTRGQSDLAVVHAMRHLGSPSRPVKILRISTFDDEADLERHAKLLPFAPDKPDTVEIGSGGFF